MSEQPETQVTEVQASTDTPSTETYAEPKGAFLFVILMLVFYVGYWFINWIEIFVLRGL
ncbi:MAG: hypothetical protein ACOYLB_09115 [Phototrophicaceae bacterium]